MYSTSFTSSSKIIFIPSIHPSPRYDQENEPEFVLKLRCAGPTEFRVLKEYVLFNHPHNKPSFVELQEDFLFPSSLLRFFQIERSGQQMSMITEYFEQQIIERVVRHALYVIVNCAVLKFRDVPIQVIYAAYVLSDFLDLTCTEKMINQIEICQQRSENDLRAVRYFEQEHEIMKEARREFLRVRNENDATSKHIAQYYTNPGIYSSFENSDVKDMIDEGNSKLRMYERKLASSMSSVEDRERKESKSNHE